MENGGNVTDKQKLLLADIMILGNACGLMTMQESFLNYERSLGSFFPYQEMHTKIIELRKLEEALVLSSGPGLKKENVAALIKSWYEVVYDR